MQENADNGLEYADKCYISQSACYEDAKAVAELVEQSFPHLKGRVEINDIGTAISARIVTEDSGTASATAGPPAP